MKPASCRLSTLASRFFRLVDPPKVDAHDGEQAHNPEQQRNWHDCTLPKWKKKGANTTPSLGQEFHQEKGARKITRDYGGGRKLS
jgi:hypothetical protein